MTFFATAMALRQSVLMAAAAMLLAWPAAAADAATAQQPEAARQTPAAEGAAAARAAPLRIVYFHSRTCAECRRVKQALAQLRQRWDRQIECDMRDIEDVNAFRELLVYEKHYGASVSAPPVIYVGSQCLVGEKPILDRLDEAIAEELAKGSETFVPAAPRPALAGAAAAPAAVPDEIRSRFGSFSVGAVAAAGLIDGVNPCAFTTIVFLLSMLAVLRKTRREMLIVGAGFAAGVLVTYFLLGLGLLGAVKVFSVNSGLSAALAWAVAALAFGLAGWSLLDAIRYIRTGSVKKVTLGLPRPVKQRIHRVIRSGLSARGLLVGSVGVGIVVALLESLCTGQVYLPTLMFVSRAPGLRTAAVSYLLLYNLMFILPLLGIIVLGYFGIKSETLGNFLGRHLAGFKLAMAGLFAGLGVLVMATV